MILKKSKRVHNVFNIQITQKNYTTHSPEQKSCEKQQTDTISISLYKVYIKFKDRKTGIAKWLNANIKLQKAMI